MRRTKYGGTVVTPKVLHALDDIRATANSRPQQRTLLFYQQMHDILAAHNPMTIRQLFYRLVSTVALPNTIQSYDKVSRDCAKARLQGHIPWKWIEDRIRRPVIWQMYNDPGSFLEHMADNYHRQVWYDQPCYIEAILEKDALSGIFQDVLWDYRVPLNVTRGFNSVSAGKNIAERLALWKKYFDTPTYLLCFGDFDPEGMEIPVTLEAAIRHHFGSLDLTVIRCALTEADRDALPDSIAEVKWSSKLAQKFTNEYGDKVVELDALPVEELERRIRGAVEALMDLDALAEVKEQEEDERERLRQLRL
jgi:hypothetical protein